jgi:hypothetical protein
LDDETFIRKILPFNLFVSAQLVRERTTKIRSFQSGMASQPVASVQDERHIELSLPNSGDVVCRCTLKDLNGNVEILLRITLYQLSKETGRHRRQNTNI